jgi:hypothetical protein
MSVLHDQSERCKFLVATGGETDIARSANTLVSVETDPITVVVTPKG